MLLVLGFHLNLPGLFRVGWVGVDLFFVLSGFLISGLLFSDYQKYGEIRLKRFWVRRAFRIIPPLYAFLAVMAAFSFALIRPFPWRNWGSGLSRLARPRRRDCLRNPGRHPRPLFGPGGEVGAAEGEVGEGTGS